MFADKLKKKYQRNLIVFSIAGLSTTTLFMIILFIFPAYIKIGLYILTFILFFGIVLFIIGINTNNKKVCDLIYKVTSLDHKIPYPQSFKKQLRTLLIDGEKGYTINKKVIPARFVEFVEGKRAYLIKELETIHEINQYKILFVHEHTYALIEDVEHKKWIIHMNCLENINA
ncbi:MAG: hypothetical protein ABH890_01750 [Bacillota bacterium]